MIRRRLAERKIEELFKRQPVVDLVFQFRIGLDAEPFLQHQTFKKQQRRLGIGALTAGAHGVMG